MFQANFGEKNETHFMFNQYFSPKNRAINEMLWKKKTL